MMKKVFFVLILATLFSCKKESTCRSYSDAIKQGDVERKTTVLNVNDSLSFELNYVRDQLYKEKMPFCYGRLELENDAFGKIISVIAPQYSSKKVVAVTLCGEGVNICNSEVYNLDDIKSYLVYYIDVGGNVFLDFYNKNTGVVETYPVSNVYATVKMYFLMERSGIVNYPSSIDIVNTSVKGENFKFINKLNDTLYLKIHNKLGNKAKL